MSELVELRKVLKESQAVYGSKETLKGLRTGTLATVFLSSTVDEATRASLLRYAERSGTEVVALQMASDALGIFCKKPFSVSVLSVLR